MAVNEESRIAEFVEKPADPPCMPGRPDVSLASMGIYVFNAEYLYAELEKDIANHASSHDFGKDIIPSAVRNGVAWAQPFSASCVRSDEDEPPYWRDVGTIDAYWEANIDLTATKPLLNLYDTDWPIWTWQEQLPPAKFVHNEPDRRGLAIESTVSGGCIISGALYRSLLFSKCRVHSYSHVNWSVLLPSVEVGRKVRLNKVVVDRGCVLPDELVVGEDPDSDAQRFHRTEGGVTLITREMLDRLA
jgi:glucose-1-phosphate adenylyltransferase